MSSLPTSDFKATQSLLVGKLNVSMPVAYSNSF